MISNIHLIILAFDISYIRFVLQNWSLEVLWGFPFPPNLAFGGSFLGFLWARGAVLGTLLGVCLGLGADGCQQQLKLAPSVSVPNSRL